MPEKQLAQWLLQRVSSRERASEMIGDLLEQYRDAPVRFNLAVAQVFVAHAWRWAVGIVVAIFSLLIPIPLFNHIATRRLLLAFQGNEVITHHWMLWASAFLFISIRFWSLTALSLVRYGIRDRLTQISVFLALVTTSAACFAWLPHATYVIPVMALLLILLLILHPNFRRPAICGACAFGAAFAIFVVLGFALKYAPSHRIATLYDPELFFVTWIGTVLVQAWVLARTRRRLIFAA
jgi:uncharacterized membrane protein YwzB